VGVYDMGGGSVYIIFGSLTLGVFCESGRLTFDRFSLCCC
jgi:uncharacterized membrane protein YhfC